MPATQRGHARRLPSGKWQLRYYDAEGERRTGGSFPSKSAAFQHYRDVIEPRLNGEPEPNPKLTLAELAELYLERHAAVVRPRTTGTVPVRRCAEERLLSVGIALTKRYAPVMNRTCARGLGSTVPAERIACKSAWSRTLLGGARQ
jgi:hypothetical protein